VNSLKLLADENFPWKAVKALRSSGYDVVWVAKDKPGSTDLEVLSRAAREKRILLTFDRDFSTLAFRMVLPAETGVILFTIPLDSPLLLAEKVVHILESRDDWFAHYSEIGDDCIRMFPLFT
jgi:hypothetical protein